MKTVSIILPSTDETYSLTQTVVLCHSLLAEKYTLQFVIVTSPTLTTKECRLAITALPVDLSNSSIVTFDQQKKGMGGALQDAFSYAKGDYVVLMASDLETDPAVLPSLLSKLEEGFDIAATTRWRGGVRFTGYNPIKLVLNYGFQLIFRTLYFTSLSDLTYAYRAYKSEVLKDVRWEETGFSFLFETIVKPLRLGYKVTEVQAPWKARTEGVSHATWKQIFAYTKLGLRVRFLPKNKIRYTRTMNEQKPALVTGGCGFVGRHLIKALLQRGYKEIWIIDDLSTGTHPSSWLSSAWKEAETDGHTVFSSTRGTLHFVLNDAQTLLLEESATSKHLPTAFGDVFHLASIVGGRSLIDGDPIMVAKDLGIDAAFFFWLTRKPERVERVLYASSSAAYPISLQGEEGAVALKESDIDFSKGLGVPDMTYGWSKMTGEYLSRLAHEKYGVHIACVRPFSGFGEDQDLTYPTPSIALRVARGDDPIEVWGTGEQGRDFIHIDNCIDACFAILEKVNDGAGVNIGTGALTSFNTLIREMLKLEEREATIHALVDKPVGVNARYADITYLTEAIGWKPKISFEEGLRIVLQGAKDRLKGTTLPFTLE